MYLAQSIYIKSTKITFKLKIKFERFTKYWYTLLYIYTIIGIFKKVKGGLTIPAIVQLQKFSHGIPKDTSLI